MEMTCSSLAETNTNASNNIMTTINLKEVEHKVNEAVKTINFDTPDANIIRLTEALRTESSATGQLAMQDIVENRRIASERH